MKLYNSQGNTYKFKKLQQTHSNEISFNPHWLNEKKLKYDEKLNPHRLNEKI